MVRRVERRGPRLTAKKQEGPHFAGPLWLPRVQSCMPGWLESSPLVLRPPEQRGHCRDYDVAGVRQAGESKSRFHGPQQRVVVVGGVVDDVSSVAAIVAPSLTRRT